MSTKDLKDIPVLATKDLVVFPNTSIPLAVASSANKINVKAASEEEKLIYIVPLKDGKHPKSFKIKDLYQTGTLCRIEQIKQQASGAYQLMLTSLKRISFENFSKDAEGVVRGVGAPIYYDYDLDNDALEPLAAHIKKNAIELIEEHKPSASKRIKELFEEIDTAELLINITASHADFKAHQKVQLLKMFL